MPTVRLHIKTLVPSSLPVSTMLDAMRNVYGPAGIDVALVSTETLFLPMLETIDIGDACVADAVTAQQFQLFSHRNGVSANEIVAYLIGQITPPHNGCAAHLQGQPSALLDHFATVWTLAHEIGHVLGRRGHSDDSHHLMYGGGTGNITDPPPVFAEDELAIIRDSPFLFPF